MLALFFLCFFPFCIPTILFTIGFFRFLPVFPALTFLILLCRLLLLSHNLVFMLLAGFAFSCFLLNFGLRLRPFDLTRLLLAFLHRRSWRDLQRLEFEHVGFNSSHIF